MQQLLQSESGIEALGLRKEQGPRVRAEPGWAGPTRPPGVRRGMGTVKPGGFSDGASVRGREPRSFAVS